MRGREEKGHTNSTLFFFLMAERIQQVLCKEGALPVLIFLLESPDSEVQVWLRQVRVSNRSSVTVGRALNTELGNEKVERGEGFSREVGRHVRVSW